MLGSALTLASFVKVLHSVFLCKPSPEVREQTIHKATWAMSAPMAVLAGLCILFGIFAYAIPLRYMIQPAVGQPLEFSGSWLAARAAGLILIVFAVGWIAYGLALRHGNLRKVPTYIGGERLDETRITGVHKGADRHVEVTGVDFYDTVERLPILKPLYGAANRKRFDIYEICGHAAARLSNSLSAAHNGVLPRYVTWFVFGLLAILYVIMEGSP
jgi:NADH:ubiquinone oxidoreductase subunit 5 (subunit L)/multisubunit Na+/H+ antiporter MnhA subunit